MLGLNAIGGIVNVAGGIMRGNQEIKQANIEARVKQAEQEAEEKRLRLAGWMDEFLILVLVMPFVASFIPGAAPYIENGFETLKNNTPDWYKDMLWVAIMTGLGLKVGNATMKGARIVKNGNGAKPKQKAKKRPKARQENK